MKNFMIILSLFLTSMSSWAQTYEEIKSENAKQLQELRSQLEKVNNRIFYFETLGTEQSQANKKGILYNNVKKKDLYFKDEELNQLNNKKIKLLADIAKIESYSVATNDQRMAKKTSNYPDRMGPVEYRQRGRSQSFRALEGVKADTDEKKELNGLLINSKMGVGETAYFQFTRTDIKENFHRLAIPVKPNTEKEVKLPMGTYYVEISCGSNSNTKGAIVHVDPRQTTQAGKKEQTVYFWAEKCLSNY